MRHQFTFKQTVCNLNQAVPLQNRSARSPFGDGNSASSNNTIQKAKKYLYGAANQISSFSDAIISKMRQETLAPDEVEIEFAVKLSADLGAVIAKAGAESEVTIKVK